MTKPRQPLNQSQTEILLILYKFRFATRDLIVSYQELPSSTYTQQRLVNLMQQEYIDRRYTGKDKIAGKPARYYLAAKGIRFLLSKQKLAKFGLNPKVLNLTYKDKHAHEPFIEQCLDIFRLYSLFTKLYGSTVDFYTRSEIAHNDLFLKPLPQAYISFGGRYQHKPDCILELMSSDKSYFIHRRRINQYLKQFASGSWQNKTGTDYPRLLLVSDSPNLERRLQKSAAYSLTSRGITGLNIYTTTKKAILAVEHAKDKVFSDVLKPEVLAAL
jgi:hypothetical protein